MQCDCKTKVAEKVGQHIAENLPEGFTDFDAKLGGYTFAMSGNTMTTRFMARYEGEVWVPKKTGGGFKRQKVSTFVAASYCPFCGTPAQPEEEA